MSEIGFVGLGNMGAPMAERLLVGGHSLVLFDVVSAALAPLLGTHAQAASSLQELGDRTETVFVSVPTPEIALNVCRALARGGSCRRIVDLSTTGPDTAVRIAEELAEHDVALIDCPVSGGVAGARAGRLALMVAATDRDLAAVRPLLDCFGRVFHVGARPGMGQMMKVINNLMSAAALAFSSEGLAIATKFGLEPSLVVDVLNAGSGRNSATLDKFPRNILTGSFDAGFSLGLMLKDVKLCLDQARSMNLDLPAALAVEKIWQRAVNEIGPGEDFTRIVRLAEQAAGINIRATREHPREGAPSVQDEAREV